MTTYIATTSGGEIDGSAGNDVMIGKSGDDTFDGGTGSDILLGGAGNDFIYYDEFDIKVDGGTGYDTLVFDGSGQTLNLGLQKTVMNFEQIDLAGSGGHQLFFSAADIIRAADNDKMRIWGDSTNTVTFNDSGWSFSGFNSGGLALFSNGGATIEVQIGLHISSFSGNSIITAQIGSDQTVTEDESTPNLSATGHFDVSDVDGQNYLTTFVAKKAGSIGSLSLTPHASIPGVSTGQYTYSVNNNLTQYLGIAEKQIDEFTVTSIDGSTETFKFTIVGVNDAAFRNAQTNDSVTGSVQEFADGQLGENTFASTINGSFVVKDVDRGDNLYSWMISGALTRGSLTSVSIGTADINGNRTISWTYILDDSHLDSLAEGGKATDVFTLRLSDRPEGTAGGDFFDQVITINQAGANDAPVRIAQTGDKVEGSVTEPAAGGAISDTTVIGKFVVQDVDISDQLFYWIETAVQVHGSLSTVSIDAADDDGNRIINWTYLIEGNKLNSLAEGINPADIFTLRISDRPQGMPGASVLSQDIQISLSGENDAPVRINQSSDVLKGSATENEDGTSGENTQFEIIKGSYFVKDVDLGDDLFYWVESTYPIRGTIYNVEFGNPSEDGSRKVTWSYYIEDHSLDSLDEISKVIDTFSLKISDHPEGTANATVLTDTITIDLFGNNDAPTIIIQQGDKIGGSVTELPSGDPNADSSYLHKVSGSFHIQEVDDVDILLNSEIVHTSTNSTLYGKLVIDSISGRDPNNNGLQVVNWTYSVTDEALDPLSDGSGSTQTFAISLTDGRATVVQNVTVELIGSAEPIIGDNNANTLDGTAGADLISGLGGIDTINGFAGDDIIYGGSGDDIISGGGGNDTIFGGDGNDEIVGGAGINNINGDDGNDSFGIEYSGGTIHGGAGFDEFSFLSDWGQADGASLRVYGDAGGDNYYFRVNEVENKSFGINIADFDPSEDSIVFFISKFKTPQSFKATLSSPDTVTITYASGTATVDICSLTFVGASPGTVDSSWLSNMVTFS